MSDLRVIGSHSLVGEPIKVSAQHLLNPADMNSKFVVNFFLVSYPDGSSEWLSRVDLKAQPQFVILFTTLKNGYNIQMEKGFLDYIREAVARRRAARNLSPPSRAADLRQNS